MSKQIVAAAAPLALANKIKRWDYDKSVAKMRPLVRQWKKATEEMLRELYLAKEFLTNQKGQHRNPDADNYIMYSWSDYCDEIGIPYQTVNTWLRPFVPRELSESGKDILQLEPPAKTESTAERALMEARIEKVLAGGRRPSNWSDREEAELKRRLENARFMQKAEELNTPAIARTKTDHFADMLKRSKDIINFKLDDRSQIMAQAAIFDHIEAYLKTFTDIEIRALAAFNLALKTRNLSNEIAETNFQLSESALAKEEGNDS